MDLKLINDSGKPAAIERPRASSRHVLTRASIGAAEPSGTASTVDGSAEMTKAMYEGTVRETVRVWLVVKEVRS